MREDVEYLHVVCILVRSVALDASLRVESVHCVCVFVRSLAFGCKSSYGVSTYGFDM